MFCSTAQLSSVGYSVSKQSKTIQKKRTKKDYAVMMRAVRKGYLQLKNDDKYLYEILVDYDYADEITGLCKGYVFPDPKRTLTGECNSSYETINRQLGRLEKAKLIKRIARQNKGPIIVLLDISEEQLSTYRNERQMSKMTFAYNRKDETKRTNNRQLQSLEAIKRCEAQRDDVASFSEIFYSAREYACYERLTAWGYSPHQAIRDITNPEIGVAEIEQQLENLNLLLQTGWLPQKSCAQWLNWAIRAKHRISAEVQREAERALELVTRKVVRYEQIVDEETNTIQLVEVDDARVEVRTTGGIEHLRVADEHAAATAVVRYHAREQRYPTRRAIPQQVRNGNPIIHVGFSRPHRASSPFPLALQFPDHTRTTSLLRYGCGQENGSAAMGRYVANDG